MSITLLASVYYNHAFRSEESLAWTSMGTVQVCRLLNTICHRMWETCPILLIAIQVVNTMWIEI
jgi:hypothetical protein